MPVIRNLLSRVIWLVSTEVLLETDMINYIIKYFEKPKLT